MDLTFSENSPSARVSNRRAGIVISSIFLILALGIYGLILYSDTNKVPQSFFSAFDKQNKQAKDIIASSQFDYQVLSSALQTNNYTAALQAMETNLSNTNAAQEKMTALLSSSIAVKKLLPQIKDTASSQTVLQLFSLIDDRNNKLSALFSEEQPFFSTMRDTYQTVITSGRGQIPEGAPKQAQQIITDEAAVQTVQSQIDTLYTALKKNAGIEDDQTVNTDQLQNALSQTPAPPALLPASSITPTPVASENAPPEGPVLPQGATTSAEASGSAK